VPRAYEKEGAYERKTMIESCLHMQKVRKKGPMMVKMKAMDLLCKYLKVPGAYESLNPAL
jgi:hypothetical protein